MSTGTTSQCFVIDGLQAAQSLQAACEKLDGSGAKVCLDFSAVDRIEPAAITALEALAEVADAKAAGISLRGVNVDVYKVLKLARLAQRFSFER